MGLLSLFMRKKQQPFERMLTEPATSVMQPSSQDVPLQPKKTWKKLALILPGGGARGAIEVGGLKTLWRYNLIPDVIIGSSVGSITSAAIASGRTPGEVEKIWLTFSKDMLLPMNYRIFWELKKTKSLARTVNLKKVLNYSVKSDYFEECKIPLYIIVTRLSDGEGVYFNKGPIRDAVLASMAVPPHYPPHLIDNIKYVDGSISGVNGIKKAVELGCDAILILNCYNTSKRYDFDGILDVTSHSLDLMFNKNMLREIDLCASPFGNTQIFLVRVPDLNIDTVDFSKTRELIQLGEEKTEELLRQRNIIR
ncbi:MAG: patatin-like phospholipase family protein [Candidatus Woesearchaeota archaeon]|nr:patatin-like phospholipase family protein [Candidatus Woesearchaeota archaeon]